VVSINIAGADKNYLATTVASAHRSRLPRRGRSLARRNCTAGSFAKRS